MSVKPLDDFLGKLVFFMLFFKTRAMHLKKIGNLQRYDLGIYLMFSIRPYIGWSIETAKTPTAAPINTIRTGSMTDERFLVI